MAYTRTIDLKFEISKNCWGGAHRPPSIDPFPALFRILLSIRASPDSDPLLLRRGCPITPILKKLHWLPIKQRIDYKLCLLTYKTLQIQQPTYLYNSISFPSHSLSTRSSDSSVLYIPYVRTSLGKRAFSVIAPRLWNSLPPDTRNSLSVSTFRSKLKTHLFKLAFPPWILSHPIIGLPTRIWFLFFLYLILALSNDTWY